MTEAEGGCHCGAVRFRVRLADGLRPARRCTCSFCRMKETVAVTVADGGFTLISGESLRDYRFNTGTARHWFFGVCGIATHHARRSVPGQLAVNAACLDGVSPFDFLDLPVMDGEAHPADSGVSREAGRLRYSPA
ncbi:GFA family protein [Paracoccus panacisoli]|uniref:GFA family protein n=1 Tax=Paracoccus panacisoli TaxID=1510163 RepID=A0ABV6T0D5_9RHOB